MNRLLAARWAAESGRRKARKTFRAEDLCRRGRKLAAQQLAFILDRSRYKVACCSRRAGKTTACAILLLQYALEKADSLCLYITLTRLSGKRIVWRRLLKLNQQYQLGGVPNRSELVIEFPNGSEIRVMGCKDESEADKIRGIDPAPRLVVLDESQAFKDYVQELVEDALEPMLLETKGTLVLIGTPGRVRSGYFYEACRSATPPLLERLNVQPPQNDNAADEDEARAVPRQWSVHYWTIADNPFIDDVVDELVKLRRRKGWTSDHPTYQREYLGRWVTEHDALVYKYDPERNGYTVLPDVSGPEWRCVIVVDQGFVHFDSIGRLWHRPRHAGIWLEEVHHEQKASAGDLVIAAKKAWTPVKGRCVKMFWDEGGGGKKVAEDARKLGLPVEPAEKPAKIAGIELTNTALRTGCLQVPLDGQAASDAARVTWDPKARGVKLSERYHTDVWDIPNYGLRALVGVVPMDRAAELPVVPVAEEVAEKDRKKRIGARLGKAGGSWVDKALGRRAS